MDSYNLIKLILFIKFGVIMYDAGGSGWIVRNWPNPEKKPSKKIINSKKYFFLPLFVSEVAASLRLPKEIKAKSKKEALIKAKEYGRGMLCEVIQEF